MIEAYICIYMHYNVIAACPYYWTDLVFGCTMLKPYKIVSSMQREVHYCITHYAFYTSHYTPYHYAHFSLQCILIIGHNNELSLHAMCISGGKNYNMPVKYQTP